MPKEVPRRILGTTGIEVSCLGLGTVKFGRNTGVKYPTSFEIPNDQALKNLLHIADTLGINYLDTAPAYGESEARLGELLGANLNRWVISTKVGEYFSQGNSHYDFSESTTIKSVENSVKRLRVEQLGIVFVHSDGNDKSIIQSTPILECLTNLKEKGLIRAIGFSGKDAQASRLAIDLVDVFMVSLNQADSSQTSLIELCQTRNKGVVIKKALSSGHTNHPDDALKFAVDFPGVTSVIVGTISPDHLKQNASVITHR